MTPRKSPLALVPDVLSSRPRASDRPFSRPWMAIVLAAIDAAGDLQEACDHAGVTLADFHLARRDDPAFDQSCRVRDEVVDLQITEALRKLALKGVVQAQYLYFNRVRGLLFGPDDGEAAVGQILDPKAAEAMLQAGLDCLDPGPRRLAGPAGPQSPALPSPSSSRPGSPRSRKSAKSRGEGASPLDP